MVFPKKMRNDKLNTKQFFICHFYDLMFFTDLDNTFTRSRAPSGGYSIRFFNYSQGESRKNGPRKMVPGKMVPG